MASDYPFTNVFIYDWYDGPTMGVALDAGGQAVGFMEILTSKEREPAFLVVRIPQPTFQGLVSGYGLPSTEPGLGTLIEYNDPSAVVADIPGQLFAAEGWAVICDSPDYRLREEIPLDREELRQLLNEDRSKRDLDAVLQTRSV